MLPLLTHPSPPRRSSEAPLLPCGRLRGGAGDRPADAAHAARRLVEARPPRRVGGVLGRGRQHLVGGGEPVVSCRGLLGAVARRVAPHHRSEEHTSELPSLMPLSYAVFCLKQKRITQ